MKLSKKNAARQRVLQKAIASGKTLGGLLVGLTAATVVGGCKDPSPASTMGSYPRPQQQANATSENVGEFVTGGAIAEPEDITEPKPKTSQPKPERRAGEARQRDCSWWQTFVTATAAFATGPVSCQVWRHALEDRKGTWHDCRGIEETQRF